MTAVAKMVLNDFQRGKLPYYVPPEEFEVPKSKANQSIADGQSQSDKLSVSESVEKGHELQQIQDFRKIRVGLELEKDDIRELEKIDLELMEKQREERKIANKRKANDDDNNNESSGISDFYSEDGFDEALNKVVRKKSKKIPTNSTKSPNGKQTLKTAAKTMASSGEFNVASIGSVEKKAPKKVTAEERRAVERAQKRKKNGSNFYGTSNVKNRNRNKKKGD